ncbi:MAG: sigma factor [Clostridiales bacterium]|nr:sigma factor [Clostridiales bacterium]
MNGEEMKAYVLLARNGDTAAFCKLYELYYKDMYRFAYYMLGNTTDAEDVISETVLDAFSSIKSLKKPESLNPCIFKILSKK